MLYFNYKSFFKIKIEDIYEMEVLWVLTETILRSSCNIFKEVDGPP